MRSLFASTLSDFDLVCTGDGRWCLRLPMPGFGPQDLDVMVDSGLLTVTGRSGGSLLRRSLALPRHLDVAGTVLRNGLLEIELVRTAPRQRRIPVGSGLAAARQPESLLESAKRRVGHWLDRFRQPAKVAG